GKMASAGGRSLSAVMVSVRTSIVPPRPRPPPANASGTTANASKPQVTDQINDFAVSLELRQLRWFPFLGGAGQPGAAVGGQDRQFAVVAAGAGRRRCHVPGRRAKLCPGCRQRDVGAADAGG